MGWLETYQKVVTLLLALQAKAPRALELIKHMAQDAQELAKLFQPDAPLLASGSDDLSVPASVEAQEQQLAAMGCDVASLRADCKTLHDAGFAQQLAA